MKTIGRYQVLGLLGRGGWAKVYKVSLPGLERVAALKLLAPRAPLRAIFDQAELRRRFLAEARTMAGLEHPHLVAVYDLDQHQGQPFYTMDYFCRNLGQVLAESLDPERPCRRLPLERILDYLRQTLLGLERLHDAGLVHRDLQPYNLLLDAADQVRLGDFGLAVASGARGQAGFPPANLRTGTPFYAAPEQEADPGRADPRADLYGVGVLLRRMLGGGLDPGQAGGMAELPPGLGPVWAEFLGAALQTDPGRRFPDARAMLAALTELERDWRANAEAACRLAPMVPDRPGTGPAGRLRARPLRVAPRQAGAVLGLDDLGRPLDTGPGVFQPLAPDCILDPAHGLVWQAGGSRHPLTWPEAQGWLANLNAKTWGGASNWRVPTLAELLTLVEPGEQMRRWCGWGAFEDRQKRIWSSDSRSALANWGLDLELGCAGWWDHTCRLHLRAVREA